MESKNRLALQDTIWGSLHKTLATGLIQSIITRSGGPVSEQFLAKELRRILENAASERGFSGLSAAIWDDLVTDETGRNREREGVSLVSHGRFSYNPELRQVATPYYQTPVELRPIEGRLFNALISNAPRFVTYGRLVEFGWDDGDNGSQYLLRTHLSHIRKKIGDIPQGGRRARGTYTDFEHIVARLKVGYKFQDPGAQSAS